MTKNKKIVSIKALCLVCVICSSVAIIAPVTFAERKFGRYEGRALRIGIPLYQGTPSAEYTYKSLGHVENICKWNFQSAGDTAFAALEGLATRAKEMGANAVIKVEPNPPGLAKGFGDFSYDGEAVIFDKLPDK